MLWRNASGLHINEAIGVEQRPRPADVPVVLARPRRLTLSSFWPIGGASKQIIALDGLRGVAVLLVMGYHILANMQSTQSTSAAGVRFLNQSMTVWGIGWSGVALFFVLSGFLLFMPYARAILGLTSFPSTRKFYVRRALRILPAYWVALALIVLSANQSFLPALKPFATTSDWRDLASHIFLVQNWDASTLETFNAVFWTMAVEAQFYLLLPLVAILVYRLARRGRDKTVLTIVGIGLLISPISSLVIWLVQQQQSFPLAAHSNMLLVFKFSIFFIAGMLGSTLFIAASEGPWRVRWLILDNPAAARRVGILGAASLALYLALQVLLDKLLSTASAPVFDGGPIFNALLGYYLMALGYVCLLISAVMGRSRWQSLLSTPIMRFIGLISYSLYIWHLPLYKHVVGRVAGYAHSDWLALFVYLILTVIVIIPFGYIAYELVERPFIRFRRAQR